jgi:hypothetical protein
MFDFNFAVQQSKVGNHTLLHQPRLRVFFFWALERDKKPIQIDSKEHHPCKPFALAWHGRFDH